MKFKFCSDGDCPQWALAALHALSSLPAQIFKRVLTHTVEETTNSLMENQEVDVFRYFRGYMVYLLSARGFAPAEFRFPYFVDSGDKIGLHYNRFNFKADDGVMEILKNTNLHSRDECARAVAVIRWVLHQSWRGGCAGAQLTRDLLVLGVPRAHASALAEVVDAKRESYVANTAASGFIINKVTDVTASAAPEVPGDMVRLTLFVDDVFTGDQKKEDMLIDKSQTKTLLEELKKAYAKMEELDL